MADGCSMPTLVSYDGDGDGVASATGYRPGESILAGRRARCRHNGQQSSGDAIAARGHT